MWKLTIELAQGGYVMALEKQGRGGSRELAVCHDGPEMFQRLINGVPGMADAAWDWAAAEMQRRMEAERGVATDG